MINEFSEGRKKYSLTQAQASELVGVPLRTWQDWEHGKRKCPEYVQRLVLEELERQVQHKQANLPE